MPDKQQPLNLVMEGARAKLISAFNETARETKLPAYLMEGIVEGILADVRARKNMELAAALNASADEGDDADTGR